MSNDSSRLTIFGIPPSRTFRVLWMANELGIAFDHVPISFLDGGNASVEFRTINPNGRIPAISDGDFHLWESLAINIYLAKKHGGPLAPQTLEEDALAVQWSLWSAFEIERHLLPVFANSIGFPPDQRDEKEKANALGRLARPLAALDQTLAARAFLAADRFTVADLNVASVLSLLVLSEIDLSHLPNLAVWLAEALARPHADYRSQTLTLPRPANWADMV